MILSQVEKQIIKICSDKWFENPVGICSLDLVENIGLSNKEIMKIMEELVKKGAGTINANEKMYLVTLNMDKDGDISHGKEVNTHIYFPSKEVLKSKFNRSRYAKKDVPEYTKRLQLGENQIGLAFFEEEVLKKYFDHPERYKIEDTLAGGTIESSYESKDIEYFNVRYGKKLINNGKTTVAAIYHDLSMLNQNEQKYWSSYEIKDFIADRGDKNFNLFLSRTYEGEFNEFPDPINDLSNILNLLNEEFGKEKLFINLKNIHLRAPVENTRKAYCDSCSELYKIVGPDNIKKNVMIAYMKTRLNIQDSELVQNKSNRELSSIQLLQLIEKKVSHNTDLTDRIDFIKKMRIEADHKIINDAEGDYTYTWKFSLICSEIVYFFQEFLKELINYKAPDC